MPMRLVGANKLEAALRDLGTEVAGRLGTNAVRAGARVIVKEARTTAAFQDRTGELRKSIKVARQVDRRHNERTSYYGSKIFYGSFLEFGTSKMAAKPWLRPAMDESGMASVQKMLTNLGAGINRVCVKNGGKADHLGVTVEPAFDPGTDE